MPGAGIGQTITVVNQSGKVVSTSKQLLSVFKEAKSAYRERKAEIVAERRVKAGLPPQANPQMKTIERGMEAYTISDDVSESTARPSPQRTKSRAPRPSHHDRRHSSSSSVHSYATETSSIYPSSNHRFSGDISNRHSESAPVSPSRSPKRHESLTRAHTTQDLAVLPPRPVSTLARSATAPIDMDLAYGEYHPSSLQLAPALPPRPDENELKSLVTKARMLLDEAQCAQHSVTAIIAHLQKNPDAMAAVALTLAEISNIASKMAPGALAAMKGSAPAVFALLASPQFLIAAGVGVGLTIVALGGYKIIKRIQARKEGEMEPGVDEMMEIGGEVSHIENWRRGIADVEMESVGTSVEGEYITPTAAAMSRTTLAEPDRVSHLKGSKSVKSKSKTKFRLSSSRSEKSSSTKEGSSTSSRRSSKSDKSDKKERKRLTEGKEKEKEKEKKPSPLRLMFN